MYSMTGFGRFVSDLQDCNITVEISSVNYRFCEININLPKAFGHLEETLRRIVKKKVTRGKCSMTISAEYENASDEVLEPNWSLIQQYISGLEEISDRFHVANDWRMTDLLKLDHLFVAAPVSLNEKIIEEGILEAAEKALEDFLSMRRREGLSLQKTLRTYFNTLKEILHQIEQKAPQVKQAYFNKLKEHIEEVLEGRALDEDRLYHEAAVFGDKSNIDEEITRLYSHLEQSRDMLEAESAVGRKFDFLIQEMNREINTISSKANDIEISQQAVEMKSVLEMVREQVQNIE